MLHLQPQGAMADPCSQLHVVACETVRAASDDSGGLRPLSGVFVQAIDNASQIRAAGARARASRGCLLCNARGIHIVSWYPEWLEGNWLLCKRYVNAGCVRVSYEPPANKLISGLILSILLLISPASTTGFKS
jgi:hypothetical protein